MTSNLKKTQIYEIKQEHSEKRPKLVTKNHKVMQTKEKCVKLLKKSDKFVAKSGKLVKVRQILMKKDTN